MSIVSDAQEARRKEWDSPERKALAKKHNAEREASAGKSSIIKAAQAEKRKMELAALPQTVLDPTEGMSGGEKFLAGAGGGMTDIAQNVGNVLGIVDDETITDRRRMDEPLKNTGAGMAGNLVGEMAALAPLGLAGKGVQLLHKASKVAKGSTLLPSLISGVTEGAAAGGLMGGPEKRGSGAIMGGVAGGTLAGAGQMIGRTFKDGLIKNTKSADELLDTIKKTTGRKSMIPVGLSAESSGGAASTGAKAIESDVLGFFPSAKGQFQSQTKQLTDDLYETYLRKAFAKKSTKGQQTIIDTFRNTDGNVLKALEKAKTLGYELNTPSQKALWKAAKSNTVGKGRFLHGEGEKGLNVGTIRSAINDVENDLGGKILKGEFRDLTDAAGEVLQRTGSGSSPYTRSLFYEGQAAGSDAIGGVFNLLAGIPAHVMASKAVQRFLQGKGVFGLQEKLVKELGTKGGKAAMEALSAARRTASGSAAKPNTQMNDRANALRQQVGEF